MIAKRNAMWLHILPWDERPGKLSFKAKMRIKIPFMCPILVQVHKQNIIRYNIKNGVLNSPLVTNLKNPHRTYTFTSATRPASTHIRLLRKCCPMSRQSYSSTAALKRAKSLKWFHWLAESATIVWQHSQRCGHTWIAIPCVCLPHKSEFSNYIRQGLHTENGGGVSTWTSRTRQ